MLAPDGDPAARILNQQSRPRLHFKCAAPQSYAAAKSYFGPAQRSTLVARIYIEED